MPDKEQETKGFVLVVDDDRKIRHMMRMLLDLNGYETDEAVDGVDALAKVEDRRPDIIVLDVMMPNMDGVTLCKLLRQDAKTEDLPIIMLSGNSRVETVRDGEQAGADRYLIKPEGLHVLTKTIDELLQNPLAEQ